MLIFVCTFIFWIYRPHMRENMWPLSFWTWLTSLNMMPSNSYDCILRKVVWESADQIKHVTLFSPNAPSSLNGPLIFSIRMINLHILIWGCSRIKIKSHNFMRTFNNFECAFFFLWMETCVPFSGVRTNKDELWCSGRILRTEKRCTLILNFWYGQLTSG
jgi:hypothetical protein